jgi:hypothetical protein
MGPYGAAVEFALKIESGAFPLAAFLLFHLGCWRAITCQELPVTAALSSS